MIGYLKKPVTIFLVAGLIACHPEVKPPEAAGPVPSAQQQAWHEMELNAFIHFSINTFTDKEWGYGDESPELFNPTQLDVEQWISTLKETGFKGVILTCKHHDGFCLWPTQYSRHSIAQSPYKHGEGDIVKAVAEACKKYGLKFGIYVSPWDRNHADYGKPEYITYYRNQLKELFSNYGPVFEMWFDGANGGDGFYGGAREERNIDKTTYYNWPKTLDLVRKMEPEVIFFSDAGPGVRWCGNERGEAGKTNWNTITPDTLYAGKPGITDLLNTGSANGTHWIPAEVDVSIRPGWFYHAREDSLVKTPQQLLDIYLTSVGRGSNLLLNIPPDQRGLFYENDVQTLQQWHALLQKEFGHNLALHATVEASSYRGSSEHYAGSLVTDDDPETYWATNDEVETGTLTINLGEGKNIKYVLLQEYIKLGQRVKAFTVEALVDNQWQEIATGTTIGYKRILKTQPVLARKIKIKITDAKACLLISNVEVY